MSILTKQGFLTHLTVIEKTYLLTHPQFLTGMYYAYRMATNESQTRYPGSLHNGLGDAFRHCYWSALLTREIGAENALAFLLRHEMFDGNPEDERQMDLHNNQVGIAIGSIIPNASDQFLISECIKALDTDKLTTISVENAP